MLKKNKKEAAVKAEHKEKKNICDNKNLKMAAGALLIIAVSAVFGWYLGAGSVPVANNSALTFNDDSKVCAMQSTLSIPLSKGMMCGTDTASCSPTGTAKVKILAFHSPTCPYCDSQIPILDRIAQESNGAVQVDYVCKAIHEGDDALCQEDTSGKYLDWATSQKLTSDLGLEMEGTPILVFNCDYQRVGSYALRDSQMNTTVEYDDLKKLINGLS